MGIKGWKVGEKEKHFIEINYPSPFGFSNTWTVKVDGKEFQKKSSLARRPIFSFEIGKREKLKIDIKWRGWEPVCYVNGIPQEAKVTEAIPPAVVVIIILASFLFGLFLLVFAATH